MEKYFDINAEGHSIKGKLYYKDIRDIKKLVLFGHGFGGHKDNKAAAKFAERVLSKYKGIAVMTFNWPCHGDDVKKKLILSDCLKYIDLTVEYIKEQFSPDEIDVYATSFGGFLFLDYIRVNARTDSNFVMPFNKIALRCPAINIYENITKSIMEKDDMGKLEKGKSVAVGFDRKVDVTLQFMNDLKADDLFDFDYSDYTDSLFIMHGTKDEIVPFAVSEEFSDKNIIEFLPVPDADHRFKDPNKMNIAIQALVDFYGF